MFTYKKVIDLTRILQPGKERFALDIETFQVNELLPGFTKPEGEWYILQEWKISSHIGTHVESPFHHIHEGADISLLPITTLFGDAIMLDFRWKKGGESIERDELILTASGRIHKNDLVIIHTGCDIIYNIPNYNRPYLSLDAIRWLIEQQISCIGIDASGIEQYQAPEQPGHLLLFEHNIPVIEELTHLDCIESDRFVMFALPIPIEGADACPIRAIAFEGVL